MKPNEINDLYNYGYKIIQNSSFFKFSLDSILLADFVNIDFADKKLVDFCTGNAPLPIILSSKIQNITGIELQKEVYDLAVESVNINNIKNIELINDNVKNIKKYFSPNEIDIITCNPPYFKYDEKGVLNKNEIKTIARHEKEITLEEIIKIAHIYLKTKGKLYLVHRSERIVEIIEVLNKYHFGIKKITCCYYDETKNCNMVLIEAKKDSKNNIIVTAPLFTKNYGGNNKWN